MRLSQKLHLLLDEYRATLVRNILTRDDPIATLNSFRYDEAAKAIQNALQSKNSLSGADARAVVQPDFCQNIEK